MRSARTTNAIERLHEESSGGSKRRPCCRRQIPRRCAGLARFCQINMRKVDAGRRSPPSSSISQLPRSLKRYLHVPDRATPNPTTPFYNVLCLAYGADAKLFEQVVSDGHLPAERAEGCEDEYAQVKRAMTILIDPFIDESLAKRIQSKQWFNLDDTLEIK